MSTMFLVTAKTSQCLTDRLAETVKAVFSSGASKGMAQNNISENSGWIPDARYN